MTEKQIKTTFMIYEALRWVGFTEQGGNNQGQLVQMFQKAIDDKAQGEPWCMAFVGHCIKHAQSLYDFTWKRSVLSIGPRLSEHVLTTFYGAPQGFISLKPIQGSVACWRHGDSSNGHAGIVSDIDGDYFWSIEGNTGPDNKEIIREGDGVYLKKRSVQKVGDMKLVGFILPWG